MTPQEWNDIRHVVINKLLDIEYHRKQIYDLVSLPFGCMEPNVERKMLHLKEINNRIQEIEKWFKLKNGEFNEKDSD